MLYRLRAAEHSVRTAGKRHRRRDERNSVLRPVYRRNVIGPKILGSSIGINGFWVMFSIILGGGLFGFWGMLLGVPVFVVIYTALGKLVTKKLVKRDLPTDTDEYMNIDHIDPVTREIIEKEKTEEDK